STRPGPGSPTPNCTGPPRPASTPPSTRCPGSGPAGGSSTAAPPSPPRASTARPRRRRPRGSWHDRARHRPHRAHRPRPARRARRAAPGRGRPAAPRPGHRLPRRAPRPRARGGADRGGPGMTEHGTIPTAPTGPAEPGALKEAIVAELAAARERSLAYTDADDDLLVRQHSPLMSPLVWDLAHVGNYEELWVLRAAAGITPLRPEIDDMYNAFKHPRRERPSLPLLGPD